MFGKAHLPLLLTGLSAFVTAQEIVDLGKLDQYDGKLDNPPALSGSTVWLSGSDSGDYDLVFSSDTQSKLKGVLEACGNNMDDKCYQDARKVLQESELQLDAGIDRRHLGYLLSKTFRKNGAAIVFAGATISLMSQWRLQHFDESFKPLRLPHGSLEKIATLDTASSVVVSAEGHPIVTITPTPDPTSLKGSQTPHVTAVSTAHGAFQPGDLAAVLDADLASRISEIMRRGATCTDGRDFDAGKTRRRQGPGPSYGAAICGVQAAAPNVQAAGALHDLLLLNNGDLHFEFANGAGDITRAAQQAVGFVLDYAPLLAIDEALAADLGTYLFALAVDTLVESLPLGAENRIQSSQVTTATQTTKATGTRTTTTATQTSSGCPDPEKTPLFCGWVEREDCPAQLPMKKGDSDEARCKTGEHQGCQCETPPDIYVNWASNEEQQAMLLIDKLLGAIKDKPNEPERPTANCDMDNLSEIPGNVFGGPKNNVYHHFCESWLDDAEFKMRVDAAGSNKDPEIIKQKKIQGRTPPPNPDVYKVYDFNLGFESSGGDGKKECAQNCTVAFDTLWSACSNSGAMNQVMQKKGSIDVGCGVFDYEIAAPAPPPSPPSPPAPPKTPRVLHDQLCYRPDEFGRHDDIHESEVRSLSGWACTGTALKTIKRDDASTGLAYAFYDNHQPVQYNVYWKDGCELEDGAEEVYPDNPLGKKDSSDTECQELFIDNYKRCLRRGGWQCSSGLSGIRFQGHAR